jgi:hypothetical protein
LTLYHTSKVGILIDEKKDLRKLLKKGIDLGNKVKKRVALLVGRVELVKGNLKVGRGRRKQFFSHSFNESTGGDRARIG